MIAKDLLVDVSEEFDKVEKGNKVEDGHWDKQKQSREERGLQQTNMRTNKQ